MRRNKRVAEREQSVVSVRAAAGTAHRQAGWNLRLAQSSGRREGPSGKNASQRILRERFLEEESKVALVKEQVSHIDLKMRLSFVKKIFAKPLWCFGFWKRGYSMKGVGEQCSVWAVIGRRLSFSLSLKHTQLQCPPTTLAGADWEGSKIRAKDSIWDFPSAPCTQHSTISFFPSPWARRGDFFIYTV